MPSFTITRFSQTTVTVTSDSSEPPLTFDMSSPEGFDPDLPLDLVTMPLTDLNAEDCIMGDQCEAFDAADGVVAVLTQDTMNFLTTNAVPWSQLNPDTPGPEFGHDYSPIDVNPTLQADQALTPSFFGVTPDFDPPLSLTDADVAMDPNFLITELPEESNWQTSSYETESQDFTEAQRVVELLRADQPVNWSQSEALTAEVSQSPLPDISFTEEEIQEAYTHLFGTLEPSSINEQALWDQVNSMSQEELEQFCQMVEAEDAARIQQTMQIDHILNPAPSSTLELPHPPLQDELVSGVRLQSLQAPARERARHILAFAKHKTASVQTIQLDLNRILPTPILPRAPRPDWPELRDRPEYQ
jgi:hypothetical protein